MKEMTIRDVFHAILNHIVLVALIPFVAVTLSAVLCWFVLPPTYTATTTMYVLNRTTESDLLSYNDINTSGLLVKDYQELAQSDRVRLGACKALGLEQRALEEDFDISVTSENNTRLISINVEYTDPAMAANVANAITGELSECILDVMQAENISIIDAAVPPEEPSGPRSFQVTAIAGAAGLLIGIGIALLMEMLNTRIKTTDDVEKILGIPVLAQVPRFAEDKPPAQPRRSVRRKTAKIRQPGKPGETAGAKAEKEETL